MTRYDHMLRALATGDTQAALVFWRSKQWTDLERARARRLLRAAAQMAGEALA